MRGTKTPLPMLESLVEAVTRYTNAHIGRGVFATAIKGLAILRSDHPKPPSHRVFKPALCVVVQGAKCKYLVYNGFD